MTKVAIITGASSGIGFGLAALYAQKGYSLGLIARRKQRLDNVKKELENKYKNDVVVIDCDVANRHDIFNGIRAITERFGRVDLLIVNAGISLASPAYESNTDHFEQTIHTNVLGAGYSAYAVIPTMLEQGFGHIAVISSLAGYRGLPEAGAYCSSKAAVNAFFESMRLDLKKFNIKVSIIRPGYIQSPMTDRNEFYMPFLQANDVGVKKIFKGIEKEMKIFAFPWPLAKIVQTLYFWPCWLYDLCLAGVKKKKRDV
tara:strand:+ start:281 stop:1051 length:771 start_codon:yes stop_codon:yes gene_type:complete